MRHSSSSLEALHKLSSRNRDLIEGTRHCGCFFCLETFEASAVTEWTPEPNGGDVTALCPKCGVDSVLPAREGAKVDREILLAMRAYWFPHASAIPVDGAAAPNAAQASAPSLLRRLTWDLWESRRTIE